MLSKRDSTLVKLGLKKGYLTEDQVTEVLLQSHSSEKPVEDVLEERGLITPGQKAELVKDLANSGERRAAQAVAPDLDRKLRDLEVAVVERKPAEGERALTAGNVRNALIDFTGHSFGPYDIDGEIARGGMGVIFRAKPSRTDVDALPAGVKLPDLVARKVISTRSAAPAAAADVERFIREIKTLITLQHPNVVRIFDSGKESGLYYYTMELVRGESVKDMAKRVGRLPAVLSLAVVRKVAEALDTIHQAGLLHRDVKPANILMDKAASPFRPVLIDFGLIKGRVQAAARPGPGGKGEVAGTPAYMSPEQTDPTGASGEVGPLSDLYSLGAVLYFLLTGRSPFAGAKAEEVIQQVRTRKPVPPSKIVPALAPELERICMRCLEKKPADRYPTLQAFARVLDRAIRRGRRGLKWQNLYLKVRRKILG